MMRIGFTGTQHGLSAPQREALHTLLAEFAAHSSEFHHGDCIGADAEAHDLATELGYYVVIHPPMLDHKRAFKNAPHSLPPRTYLARNGDIVRATQLLVACPRQMGEQQRSGTWATVRYARSIFRPIYFVWPDGTRTEERTNAEPARGD